MVWCFQFKVLTSNGKSGVRKSHKSRSPFFFYIPLAKVNNSIFNTYHSPPANIYFFYSLYNRTFSTLCAHTFAPSPYQLTVSHTPNHRKFRYFGTYTFLYIFEARVMTKLLKFPKSSVIEYYTSVLHTVDYELNSIKSRHWQESTSHCSKSIHTINCV